MSATLRSPLTVTSRVPHEIVIRAAQGPDGEIRIVIDSQINYVAKYGTHIRPWDTKQIEIQQVER